MACAGATSTAVAATTPVASPASPAAPAATTAIRADRRPLAWLGLALTAALLLVAVMAGPPGPVPPASVLAEQGTPGPPIAVAPAATSGPIGPVAPAGPGSWPLVVVTWSMPTWGDGPGPRRGQVLLVVENRGPGPVEVLPARSRFTVTGPAGDVATGPLDAVVPPVLGPGERAVAVASVSLTAPLPAGAVAAVDLRVRDPRPSLVEIEVRRVRLDTGGPAIAASGIVRSLDSRRTVRGVVAVVLLDAVGRPLGVMFDEAGAGTLEPGERRPFIASDPPFPAGSLDAVDVVAYGWATRERVRDPVP